MEINLSAKSFVCIFGRPDSGKSYLANYYQKQMINNGVKCVTITPLKSQKDSWNPRNTIYLERKDLQPKDEAVLYINKIMQLCNYAIFFDEAHYVFHQYIDSGNNQTDLALSAFVRHHAHSNVGAWFITQRAVKFYTSALALSDYIICFRQKFPDDVDRIAEVCDPEFAKVTTTLNFDQHEYAIYDMKKDVYEIINPTKSNNENDSDNHPERENEQENADKEPANSPSG